MKSLTNLFKSMKTTLNKIEAAKQKKTKEKYQDELQKNLDDALNKESCKQDLERQRREKKIHDKQEKELQKKLRETDKRQKKLDYERRQQDAKFKKLKKQQELSSRLLLEAERDRLLIRKYTHALSSEELNNVNRKLSDDNKEQIRPKKLAEKQGKDIRDPKRCQRMNEKFNFLNEAVKQVRVVRSEKSTQSGRILIYDIYSKNESTLDMTNNFTMTDFLESVKPEGLNVLRLHNTSKKVQFKIYFTMNKYRLLTGELQDSEHKIFSTKFLLMFHGTDLNELYDKHKNDLISKLLAIQLKGSGWVLGNIEKLQIVIANYTPFSSFKNYDGNVGVNKNDRGETEFNIGKFWKDKKGIIVPQNKDDPNCFLYACVIGKVKPTTNSGRITKKLLEQIKTFNVEVVNFPPDKRI